MIKQRELLPSSLSALQAIQRRPHMYFGGNDPRATLQNLAGCFVGVCSSVICMKINEDLFRIRVQDYYCSVDSVAYIQLTATGSMPVLTPLLTLVFAEKVIASHYDVGIRHFYEKGEWLYQKSIPIEQGRVDFLVYY